MGENRDLPTFIHIYHIHLIVSEVSDLEALLGVARYFDTEKTQGVLESYHAELAHGEEVEGSLRLLAVVHVGANGLQPLQGLLICPRIIAHLDALALPVRPVLSMAGGIAVTPSMVLLLFDEGAIAATTGLVPETVRERH